MKKVNVTMYKCDYCGQMYDTEYACNSCEKQHEKNVCRVILTISMAGEDRGASATFSIEHVYSPTEAQLEQLKNKSITSEIEAVINKKGFEDHIGKKWIRIVHQDETVEAESTLKAHVAVWIENLSKQSAVCIGSGL